MNGDNPWQGQVPSPDPIGPQARHCGMGPWPAEQQLRSRGDGSALEGDPGAAAVSSAQLPGSRHQGSPRSQGEATSRFNTQPGFLGSELVIEWENVQDEYHELLGV